MRLPLALALLLAACACVGGSQGAQVCDAAGAFGACVCPDASGSDVFASPADAPAPDAAQTDTVSPLDVASMDSTALSDAAEDRPVSCGDTASDPMNCGRCGNACPMVTGSVCYRGQCETPATVLPAYRQCMLMGVGGTCPAPLFCAPAPYVMGAPPICTRTCRSDAECPGPNGVCLPVLSNAPTRVCSRRCSGPGSDAQCADLGTVCRAFGVDIVWACVGAR